MKLLSEGEERMGGGVGEERMEVGGMGVWGKKRMGGGCGGGEDGGGGRRGWRCGGRGG